MPGRPVIHWFRRDLRIADNPGLSQASKRGGGIIPVYFLSEWRGSHSWTGANRQYFLCGSLASLSRNLETLGGRLIIRSGEPVEGLRKLIRETNTRLDSSSF